MAFIVFLGAWLVLLGLFISTGGEPEKDSSTMGLGWLCIGVLFLVALYTMFMVGFMAGLGMIGSLAAFQVVKAKNDGKE